MSDALNPKLILPALYLLIFCKCRRLFGAAFGQGLSCMISEGLSTSWFSTASMLVSVPISIRTCRVKVDDSGSGVLRDGLVLKGERYVTSKYSHSDDMHAFPTSFGFKGEALSLISDVCLLEIVTKIHGRPNGYCKFLKVYWTASVCTLELMIVDKMLVQQLILYKPT